MVETVSASLEYFGTVQPKATDGLPYLPSRELVEAVNLAIYLERPLLLKGEPGCGKTQLASAVADELGLPLESWYVSMGVADSSSSAVVFARNCRISSKRRLGVSLRSWGLLRRAW